jgi:hypothetical protein
MALKMLCLPEGSSAIGPTAGKSTLHNSITLSLSRRLCDDGGKGLTRRLSSGVSTCVDTKSHGHFSPQVDAPPMRLPPDYPPPLNPTLPHTFGLSTRTLHLRKKLKVQSVYISNPTLTMAPGDPTYLRRPSRTKTHRCTLKRSGRTMRLHLWRTRSWREGALPTDLPWMELSRQMERS